MWLLHVPLHKGFRDKFVFGTWTRARYHQMLKGSSNRVIRIPLSILRARSPSACIPGVILLLSVYARTIFEKYFTSVRVKTLMFFAIIVRRVVFVEALKWLGAVLRMESEPNIPCMTVTV